MDFTNNKTNEYVCFIQLIKDIDVKVIQYEVDGISHSLILSNKSTYAIYLGTFHHLYLEDYPYYKVRITPFANRFKNCFIEYKISNPKQEIVPYATNGKLFEDEGDTGENTYLCMKRIMNMVMHYVDSRDKNLLDNIVYGLDYLIANFYQGQKNYSGNWWPYEIGIPRVLHEIIFTLYNDLPKEKVFNYLNITSFYVPNALYIFYRRNWPMQKYEVATYANLADNIYIALLKAIMLEDNSTLNYLFRLIKRTLKFTKHNDGFYADGSFIQHKNIPYNASYGEVLLNSLTKLLKIFKLINFNIKEYCQKLINIIKISYEPFLYNHYALEATRGRAVSRKSQDASYSYQIIVKSIKLLANLSDNEYLFNLLNNLENNNYDIEALAFNYMDRYLYRNNEFAITFNNNSAYIANYEAINGENLLGFYQANGTYDLYYNNKNKLEEVKINPYYRCGSTNALVVEKPNEVYKNNLSIGVVLDNLLSVYFHNETYYSGNFSRFVLANSIIFVGSNINSKEVLHHTIYDDSNLTLNGSLASANEILIKNVDNAKLVDYSETRSYADLNVNEDKTIINCVGKRLIIPNVKEYSYQIYPSYKNVDDDYTLINNDDYHILQYSNYLMINSFTNKILNYEIVSLKGKISLIMKYDGDYISIKVATGQRKKAKFSLEILDYQLIKCTGDHVGDEFVINDELEHLLVFRRK